jgi:hypothetical protein
VAHLTRARRIVIVGQQAARARWFNSNEKGRIGFRRPTHLLTIFRQRSCIMRRFFRLGRLNASNRRPEPVVKVSRPASFCPRVEVLEGRALPSILTVSTSADSGPGSLRAAVAAANSGDTIVFVPSVHKITLTSGELTVTKSLNVAGPGANRLTVSGNDASRVFDIAGGVTVTLSRLTLAHGLATQGGAIDNAGTLVIGDATFSDNRSAGGMGGGAIDNEPGSSLTLSRSTLADNTATAAAAADVFGGALLNQGHAVVTASTFSGNQALGGAGPIFAGSQGGAIDNFEGATLVVSTSTFTDNQAIGAAGSTFGVGGAIESNAGFVNNSPSTVDISNCVFTGNLATGGAGSIGNGGALDDEGPGTTMTVISSSFIDNQSVGGPGGDGVTTLSQGIGGGILKFLGTLTVSNCAFLGNLAAGGSGGSNVAAGTSEGASFGGGLATLQGTALVTDCMFAGNQAIGGDSAAGPGGIAQGGGVLNAAGSLTVSDSTFVANTARGGQGAPGAVGGLGVGGGFDTYFGSPSATVTGTSFEGNQALGGAGGAGASGGLGVGGAIGMGQDVLFGFTDNPSLTLAADTFGGNLAQGGPGGSGGTGGDAWGGALVVVSGTAGGTASAFSGNQAAGGTGGPGGAGGNGLGGGLFNNTDTTLALTASTVEHNRAKGGKGKGGGGDGEGIGGGVYSLGTLSLDASVIKKNRASTSNDDIFP